MARIGHYEATNVASTTHTGVEMTLVAAGPLRTHSYPAAVTFSGHPGATSEPPRGPWNQSVQGISRTMIRLVPPGVPVRRPAVSTTRAPLGRPAASRATISAPSIMSSTDSATSIV